MDYDEAEDFGLGHMGDNGFVWYETPTTVDANERIDQKAQLVANRIEDEIESARIQIAKLGWGNVTNKKLCDMLPRRTPDENRAYGYPAPFQTSEGVSLIMDAQWREVWQSRPRYAGDAITTIKYATVAGVEIMSIDNGFDYEPYFIKKVE